MAKSLAVRFLMQYRDPVDTDVVYEKGSVHEVPAPFARRLEYGGVARLATEDDHAEAEEKSKAAKSAQRSKSESSASDKPARAESKGGK